MPWIYEQRTGRLLHLGELVATGYSGWDDGDGVAEPGEGKNDPARQHVRGKGPIPRGSYMVNGPPFQHPKCGAYCLRLVPAPDNEMFGRAGFLVHGDSRVKPGTASEGCIIVHRTARERIWRSGDRYVEVIEGDEPAERNVA